MKFMLKSACALFLLQVTLSTSAQIPPQTRNRFLFIINTSSTMRRMTNGIQEAALGLLKSGMQGQLRDGDTLGLWTYDDELNTGFPMQVWSDRSRDAIIQTVSNYLAQPRLQGKAHLDKVLPAALQLVGQSRVITLIFIFDGSETMQGTGFDQDINDLQKEFGRQMRSDNIPFVTVLAARDGKVFDYRVRTPSSASLPQTASFFDPPRTNAVPIEAAATVPPPPVVAPQPVEPRHREVVLRPPPPETNLAPVTASTHPAPPENLLPILEPEPIPAVPPPPVEPPTPAPSPNLDPNPVTPPIAVSSAVSSNPQSAIRNSQSLPPAPAPIPPVVSTAILSPPNNHLTFLVLAVSLVAVAVAMVLLLVRRPRGGSSIISQSMDHRR
jgi:hypothetical protein